MARWLESVITVKRMPLYVSPLKRMFKVQTITESAEQTWAFAKVLRQSGEYGKLGTTLESPWAHQEWVKPA